MAPRHRETESSCSFSSEAERTLDVVDSKTLAITKKRVMLPEIPVEKRDPGPFNGSPSHGIGVAQDDKTLWVASEGSNTVSAIDIASKKEVARIKVGESPKRNITAVLR